MPDLRWEGPDPLGYLDLIDASGRVVGFVATIDLDRPRGYVLKPGTVPADGRYAAILDHPDEPTARAWVEAEVARREGGTGGADGV